MCALQATTQKTDVHLGTEFCVKTVSIKKMRCIYNLAAEILVHRQTDVHLFLIPINHEYNG